jgi:hypothetical protein
MWEKNRASLSSHQAVGLSVVLPRSPAFFAPENHGFSPILLKQFHVFLMNGKSHFLFINFT